VLVAGGLDADDHDLGAEPAAGRGDQPQELGQASPVGDHSDTIDHDLPKQGAGDHEPGRLGDIDADQQDPLRINSAHQFQERARPLAPTWAPCIIDRPLSAGCSL
jgi:hypothetical protein